MRAGWLVIAGLLLAGAASPLWAGPFTEVPADHWGYAACARLASHGVLSEDRATAGSEQTPITRFEFGIALLGPLTSVQQAADALPPAAPAQARLRAVLDALRLSPRQSEEQIARALKDLRRLAVEFGDILGSMGMDAEQAARTLGSVISEDAIRAWRLEALARPAQQLGLRGSAAPQPADGIRVPLAHGFVGLSLDSHQDSPKLLDYLALSSSEQAGDLAAGGAAEPALVDPRVSRLRTSYEYGLGSALTLSLAYEEVARRGHSLAPLDAASLTSIGIGYQLTRSTAVKLSYSLLEYLNYALDAPPVRDWVAETAVSIEF